jgi:hypothetical protein
MQKTQIVSRNSALWNYIPGEVRGLLEDGEHLLMECHAYSGKVSDYSYVVFPFAKAYEGFLKRLFLDLDLINEEDFYGEAIRIGRILNPIFKEKDYSVYSKLKRYGQPGELAADKLWAIWRNGRNQVFHYFPHNFRRLTEKEAANIVKEFISAMNSSIDLLNK